MSYLDANRIASLRESTPSSVSVDTYLCQSLWLLNSVEIGSVGSASAKRATVKIALRTSWPSSTVI